MAILNHPMPVEAHEPEVHGEDIEKHPSTNRAPLSPYRVWSRGIPVNEPEPPESASPLRESPDWNQPEQGSFGALAPMP
jgi:hypothetical protein